MEGDAEDNLGRQYTLDTSEGWLGRKDEAFHIVSESDLFDPLQILENTGGSMWQKGWMKPGYDTTGWALPYVYPDMNRACSPGNLEKRTIPFLYRKNRKFEKVMQLGENALFAKEEWEDFLFEKRSLCIPEKSTVSVEISAGEEMTGYLHLLMEKRKRCPDKDFAVRGLCAGRGDW